MKALVYNSSPQSNRRTSPGSPHRPLVVMKFGGTSVANVERISEVARMALESQQAGNDVVLVVSAMSGETNRLLKLAHEVVAVPDTRELDAIAATGEQVSAALTALAISRHGGKGRSFLGHQVRIVTDDAFTKARIHSIEHEVLHEALAARIIPVVAGFQGVDSQNHITTLGRGGSDTTAVALAAALGADECEIYTDVDGVYTADPNICPSARQIPSLGFEEMLELAALGAKVLQSRSVEIAMKYKVPVHVRSTFSGKPGTWVIDKSRGLESHRVTGLAVDRRQTRVQLVAAENRSGLLGEVLGLLAELNMSVDMVTHSVLPHEPSRASVAFSMPTSEVHRAQTRLEQLGEEVKAQQVVLENNLAKVSLVGLGIRSDPQVSATACRVLNQEGIALVSVAAGELRVSCLVQDGQADKALNLLHDAFELGAENGDQPVEQRRVSNAGL
ncbi:aspartate kinase [Stigmatella sp. ncwal1]|uniref:Aspartokinase n=1 Tax=Stigmatella ashevillensis TaxID=2995309 RepID=A0ABT5DMJ2_9BACT|nr:aspartate kinase [Stigmatella ashevillena]MDC0714882.1 aspartate kinase [Stigmatella ashevillena]